MGRLWADTHPDVERIMIEAYRRMTPSEKLRAVCDLNATVRSLALADIRRRHPEADDRECALRVASRWIDAELMRNAFGWDPDQEGY